jgi:hypothetical protein
MGGRHARDRHGRLQRQILVRLRRPSACEKLHTIERYRRPEFGKLTYEVTIDDPGAYTKPFTLYGDHTYESDTELIEYICNENNQDVEHIVGKDPRNEYTNLP